jgi:hypothetical protein
MIWKGKELNTVGEILDAVCNIYYGKLSQSDASREEDAEAFLNAYLAENPYARENIGYIAGYCSPETAVGILQLFGVRHPVFGGPEGFAAMTPEKAFELGKQEGAKC